MAGFCSADASPSYVKHGGALVGGALGAMELQVFNLVSQNCIERPYMSTYELIPTLIGAGCMAAGSSIVCDTIIKTVQKYGGLNSWAWNEFFEGVYIGNETFTEVSLATQIWRTNAQRGQLAAGILLLGKLCGRMLSKNNVAVL